MPSIEPVGEFGSRQWCEACGEWSVKQLEEANLPADMAWGFSEVYTHLPERLMPEGPEVAGYYIMVKDTEISAGDGAPAECLELPGFHITARWGVICNQSGRQYGREGGQQRQVDQQAMYRAIEEYRGQPREFVTHHGQHVWPDGIRAALIRSAHEEGGTGYEEGGGLHNVAAKMQKPSPELADLPTTVMGVPDFANMTESQKQRFLNLCAVDTTAKPE